MLAVSQIVAEKLRFKKNPHNYAMRKTQLMKQLVSVTVALYLFLHI